MVGIPNRLSVDHQKSVGGPDCVRWGRNLLVGDATGKKIWIRKIEKVEFFFDVVSKNVVLCLKQSDFRDFFVFGSWCPLLRVCTENTSPFSGPILAPGAPYRGRAH